MLLPSCNILQIIKCIGIHSYQLAWLTLNLPFCCLYIVQASLHWFIDNGDIMYINVMIYNVAQSTWVAKPGNLTEGVKRLIIVGAHHTGLMTWGQYVCNGNLNLLLAKFTFFLSSLWSFLIDVHKLRWSLFSSYDFLVFSKHLEKSLQSSPPCLILPCYNLYH